VARRKNAPKIITPPRYHADKRAIIGVRVSEGRGRGHERISDLEQARSCRGLLQVKGLTEAGFFQEIGVSGDANREALEGAIQQIENREAAWLVVYAVDRLGRDFMDVAATMERVVQAGGCLLIAEPLLDSSTDAGQLIITILAQLARAERVKITKRWGEAQASAWRRGFYPGDLPCGLRNPTPEELGGIEPGAPMLRQVAAEVAAIRDVAKALIEESISWPEAARRMTAGLGRGGKRNRDGTWMTAWSPNGVRKLFSTRMLVGEVTFGEFEPTTCDPILTFTEFETINGKRVTRESAARNQPTHIGAKMLRCSGCRYVLHRRRAGNGVLTYFCRNEACRRRVKNEAAGPVEQMLELVAFDAHRDDVESWQALGHAEGSRSVEDVDAALAEAKLRSRKFAMLLAEDPDDEDMKAAREAIKEQIRGLEAERRTLENALGGSRAGFLFPELWASLEPWEKIDHVNAVLDVVFLDAGDAPLGERIHPFASGTYPRQLPSKGRRVPLSPLSPDDVPLQIRVPSPTGA
jgi:DNA invertase Pin-like site-specific DNA recombinase